MIQLHVCPSTLAEGFDTYSPSARKLLFDGNKVNHYMDMPSPDTDDIQIKETLSNVGRISLSGAQPKFSVLVGEDRKLRYTKEGEQGTYILKPRPNAYQILNKDNCAANEHLTMQIAEQVYIKLKQHLMESVSSLMMKWPILQGGLMWLLMEENISRRILQH